MRLAKPTIVVLTALLLAGCAGAPTPAPTATKTSTPTPTSLTEQQKADQLVTTNVNLYGKLVCGKLAELPDANVNDLVAKVLEMYPAGNVPEDQKLGLARRALTESAAKFCPEQSERIATDLQNG
ncbi:hypothetical protein [Compostimonas suwonensis]|uniref:DUF732 domain-containing protein n=1 Tax=Compostimonas suwonensis TaxID=1048394 RepID=A0A2M9BCD4_9MICO|nr:hypothetical protein [Compostimonas suwonensis]PJJ55572.1 hypothetical protein CLV54_2919 [Compostimonas suwonensis]